MTGLRRIAGAFRQAHAELLLAAELIWRPARRPRPPQQAEPPAEVEAPHEDTSGRAGRAA